MVRYHLSHLVWWALGAISALIVALAAVFALTRFGILTTKLLDTTWWYATCVATPLLTGVSFAVKPAILRGGMAEWSLHRVVVKYERTLILVMMICLVAGLLPCIVAALSGEFGYPLLIVVVPLAALIAHFPHAERFSAFVEGLLEEHAAQVGE